jgi:hypothetical protein
MRTQKTVWILNYEGKDVEVSHEVARGNLGPMGYAELMFNGVHQHSRMWELRG